MLKDYSLSYNSYYFGVATVGGVVQYTLTSSNAPQIGVTITTSILKDSPTLPPFITISSPTYYDIDMDMFFNLYPDCDKFYYPSSFDGIGLGGSYYNACIVESGQDIYRDIASYCHEKRILLPDYLIPLPTLNGNGCEFIDGKQVTVQGRNTVYSVTRSYMGLVTDNSYTTFYDLSANTGEKLTVPEALLTLYVAPVTVP